MGWEWWPRKPPLISKCDWRVSVETQVSALGSWVSNGLQGWVMSSGPKFRVGNICACILSLSVMSDSLQPFGLQPARFLCPRDFPGKTTGVGCYFLLQGIFLTQGSNLHLLYWQTDTLPLCHLESLENMGLGFKKAGLGAGRAETLWILCTHARPVLALEQAEKVN